MESMARMFVAVSASHSVIDRVSSAFTGRFTKASMWHIVGGIVPVLVGLPTVPSGARGGSV